MHMSVSHLHSHRPAPTPPSIPPVGQSPLPPPITLVPASPMGPPLPGNTAMVTHPAPQDATAFWPAPTAPAAGWAGPNHGYAYPPGVAYGPGGEANPGYPGAGAGPGSDAGGFAAYVYRKGVSGEYVVTQSHFQVPPGAGQYGVVPPGGVQYMDGHVMPANTYPGYGPVEGFHVDSYVAPDGGLAAAAAPAEEERSFEDLVSCPFV
jgi:hypothetical protein